MNCNKKENLLQVIFGDAQAIQVELIRNMSSPPTIEGGENKVVQPHLKQRHKNPTIFSVDNFLILRQLAACGTCHIKNGTAEHKNLPDTISCLMTKSVLVTTADEKSRTWIHSGLNTKKFA